MFHEVHEELAPFFPYVFHRLPSCKHTKRCGNPTMKVDYPTKNMSVLHPS